MRRRSSRAGALELPASLIYAPMPEVPQDGVASRWSRVSPIAGSGNVIDLLEVGTITSG